jgi:hypothetical protein
MEETGGDAEEILARFAEAGADIDALAMQLQRDGAEAFVKSWRELLQRISDKSAAIADSTAGENGLSPRPSGVDPSPICFAAHFRRHDVAFRHRPLRATSLKPVWCGENS